ncbi:MAG: hypothetical protein EB023_01500 [Flavobacteriia bacterium]|nr:hypothetical protein [Flavobacteriia bacterium]
MTWKTKIWKIVKWTSISITSLILLISLLLYVFEDKICQAVLTEAGKEFREPVFFESADVTFWSTFPNLAVNINDVRINDAFKTFKGNQQLLKAKRIRMVFNPLDLWQENYHIKVIELRQGELNIRTSKNGETNYNIFYPSEQKSESAITAHISSFRTVDFRVNYLDFESDHWVRTTLNSMTFSGNFNEDQFEVSAAGEFNLDLIKSGQVEMIKNKPVEVDLALNVNAKNNSVSFPVSKLSIAEIPFSFGGTYTEDSMRFTLQAKALPLTEVVNKLAIAPAQKELQTYRGKGTVDFNLLFASKASSNKTNIVCGFSVHHGFLQEPLKNTRISDISLQGNYSSNGNPKDDKLILKNLKFRTLAGPFSGNLTVSNFLNPRIYGHAMGGLELNALHQLFKNDFIERIQGHAQLNTEFDVQVEKNVHVNKMNGNLRLDGVEFKAQNDHRVFNNIRGNFILHGSTLGIEAATLAVNQSDLQLDGRMENIYDFFANKGTLKVDCAINSQKIAVEDLGKTSKEEKRDNKGKQFVLPTNIDGVIHLQAKCITYDNHRFENLNSPVTISASRLNFSSIAVRNGGADVFGNLNIQEDAPEHLIISAKVQSKNITFNPLFKEWNNFDQSVITSKQIEGNAEAEVDFYAPFDLIGGIDLHQMKVLAHLKVVNGSLHQVQAIEEVAASLKTNAGNLFIGKKNIETLQKNLKNISFSTLENTFLIEHGVLTIPSMRIESSAMNLDLSGSHTFEQMIDYRIKFDFRELLGEDRDAEFGTILDDGTGLKIYLRMVGHIDNPSITWDKSQKKQDIKEQISQEKENMVAMLKSEWGLFKKDSTVKEYQTPKETKETVKVQFNNPSDNKEKPALEKPAQKEGKMKSKLNQWKNEQQQNQVSVVVKKG